MPSSYSSSLRLEEQFTGENVNVWGVKLNTAIERIDFSIAGYTSIALTASRAATASNTATDEARSATLNFTGAGGFTYTIPSVSKQYCIRNGATLAITISTGSGDTVQVDNGDVVFVYCDGTNVRELGYGGYGIKDYISAIAWDYNAGNLPAQIGNAGKFVKTDGSAATWQQIQTTDIGDWEAQKAILIGIAAAI